MFEVPYRKRGFTIPVKHMCKIINHPEKKRNIFEDIDFPGSLVNLFDTITSA